MGLCTGLILIALTLLRRTARQTQASSGVSCPSCAQAGMLPGHGWPRNPIRNTLEKVPDPTSQGPQGPQPQDRESKGVFRLSYQHRAELSAPPLPQVPPESINNLKLYPAEASSKNNCPLPQEGSSTSLKATISAQCLTRVTATPQASSRRKSRPSGVWPQYSLTSQVPSLLPVI